MLALLQASCRVMASSPSFGSLDGIQADTPSSIITDEGFPEEEGNGTLNGELGEGICVERAWRELSERRGEEHDGGGSGCAGGGGGVGGTGERRAILQTPLWFSESYGPDRPCARMHVPTVLRHMRGPCIV